MGENDAQVALTINKNLSLDALGVRVGKCVEPCKIKKKVTTTILTGASQLVCGIRSGSAGECLLRKTNLTSVLAVYAICEIPAEFQFDENERAAL